jgi:hypothetical protein
MKAQSAIPESNIKKEIIYQMKKIMIAVMGLSLLTGTATLFAHQNTSTDTAAKKKSKKKKKSTSTDTMAPKS